MLTDNVTGERFCEKCGYVVSEELQDSGPEWRSFSKESGTDPTRTGAPTSLAMHDRGLSTIINPINRDSSGKIITSFWVKYVHMKKSIKSKLEFL